jgi:hypothetical protein
MKGGAAFNTVKYRPESFLSARFFGPQASHKLAFDFLSMTDGPIFFEVNATVPVFTFNSHVGGMHPLHDKTIVQSMRGVIGTIIDGKRDSHDQHQECRGELLAAIQVYNLILHIRKRMGVGQQKVIKARRPPARAGRA